MDDLAIALGPLLLGGLLAQRGWTRPGPMPAAAPAFQIVAGLGLALGVPRPWAALGLAAFTIAASLTPLDFWRVQGQQREGLRSCLLVDVGLLGGRILAFGETPTGRAAGDAPLPEGLSGQGECGAERDRRISPTRVRSQRCVGECCIRSCQSW